MGLGMPGDWNIDNIRIPVSEEFAPLFLFCIFSCNYTFELEANCSSAYTLCEITAPENGGAWDEVNSLS